MKGLLKTTMRKGAKTFKKYIIPHEENDFRPHLFRAPVVGFVCALALIVEAVFLFGSAYLIPRSELFGQIVVNALVSGTNGARIADGLPSLRESTRLDLAAQEKANNMVQNNYFAHTSPSGLTPWYWFEQVGYNFVDAGENLAVNFQDSSDVTSAWLASPEHRANILDPVYTDIGMATAQGTFNGEPAIYVVELFGTPAPAPFAYAPAPHAPTSTAPAKATIAVSSNPAQTAAVAVKGASVAAVPPAVVPAATSVPAAAPASATAPTALNSPASAPAPAYELNAVQAAAADPRRVVDIIFFAIALLFAAALVANLFMKLHLRHPRLVFGGMLVILVAGLLVVLNQHFGTAGIVVL